MQDAFNRPINYLRISVTDRCNLRCIYCMPAEGIPLLPHDAILSIEEIVAFTSVAVAHGIDKVRLTGGEPLVRKGIVDLVARLARIEGIRDLALTTNGILLAPMAQELRAAGLHRLNVSLDSTDPDTYRSITRGGAVQAVLDGIEAARAAGFDRIKLNCVVEQSPDEPDARAVQNYGATHHLEVRYIPRMETENGRFAQVIGGEGGHCATCNRLRLSSTGILYPCLFCDRGYAIRVLGAAQAIALALANKPAHGTSSHHRFNQIGG